METDLLSRGPAGQGDAALLWPAVPVGRDQQYVLSNAQGIHAGSVGGRGARRFQVCAEGAAAYNAHSAAEGYGWFGGVSARNGWRTQGSAGAALVSIAADFKEGCRAASPFSGAA